MTAEAFKAYIEVGLQEAAILREHAMKRGIPIQTRNRLLKNS